MSFRHIKGPLEEAIDDWLFVDIHLSAFLDSPVLVRSKPPVTQLSLQKALEFCGSEFLEVGFAHGRNSSGWRALADLYCSKKAQP